MKGKKYETTLMLMKYLSRVEAQRKFFIIKIGEEIEENVIML